MKKTFLLLCAALLPLTGCNTMTAESSEPSSAEREPPVEKNEYTKRPRRPRKPCIRS